jgi:hypothetical protein
VAGQAAAGNSHGTAWRAVRQVWGSARGVAARIKALLDPARAGRAVAPKEAFILHLVAPRTCHAAVQEHLACASHLALSEGGVAIAATVPRLARANPFPGLDANGGRWAGLNVKMAHLQVQAFIHEHQQVVECHRSAMNECGVRVSWLCSALGNYSSSFEAVFHWLDSWLPLHQQAVDPILLASCTEPALSPHARWWPPYARKPAPCSETSAVPPTRSAGPIPTWNSLTRPRPYCCADSRRN